MSRPVSRRSAFAVLGVLGALVAVNVPSLGSDEWPFASAPDDAGGLLGPLVRAADGEWDLGVVRTPAVLAGLLVACAAVAGWRAATWRRGVLLGLCLVVIVLVAAGGSVGSDILIGSEVFGSCRADTLLVLVGLFWRTNSV